MQNTSPANLEMIVSGPQIMELPSSLDSNAAQELREDVTLCIESGALDMVMDAEKTTFMTAEALRVFISLAKTMRAAGGSLSICNLHGQAEDIFDACGLSLIVANHGFYESPSLHSVA